MVITFDHLVHFTINPEEAKASFEKLGFLAVNGGQHLDWGTYNSLSYFQHLRYIEWIGFKDFEKAVQSDNILIQQIVKDSLSKGEGFSQIAFRTEKINELKDKIIRKGLTPIGPFHGSRMREDGTLLSWSMLFIKDETDIECRYPFFIQWNDEENIRNKQLVSFLNHPNGTPSLSYIGFYLSKRDKSLIKYTQLFDIKEKSIEDHVDGFGHFYQMSIGGVELRFYQAKKDTPNAWINRPFLCGIKGTLENKTVKINNSLYQLII